MHIVIGESMQPFDAEGRNCRRRSDSVTRTPGEAGSKTTARPFRADIAVSDTVTLPSESSAGEHSIIADAPSSSRYLSVSCAHRVEEVKGVA